jgi:hypothetical protein
VTLQEIEEQLPWGFHDSYWVRFEIDWQAQTATLDLRAPMDKHQETFRLARILIKGLRFATFSEPTDSMALPPTVNDLPWIDGRPGAAKDLEARLPSVPDGYFLHHIYVRETWQFLHLCGRDATLTWLEPMATPLEGAARAYFPGEEIPDPKGGAS